MSTCETIFL